MAATRSRSSPTAMDGVSSRVTRTQPAGRRLRSASRRPSSARSRRLCRSRMSAARRRIRSSSSPSNSRIYPPNTASTAASAVSPSWMARSSWSSSSGSRSMVIWPVRMAGSLSPARTRIRSARAAVSRSTWQDAARRRARSSSTPAYPLPARSGAAARRQTAGPIPTPPEAPIPRRIMVLISSFAVLPTPRSPGTRSVPRPPPGLPAPPLRNSGSRSRFPAGCRRTGRSKCFSH